MESLERLHEQLHSLEQLRAIVSTMKVLSAASIRQYEQAVRSLAGYYQTVERGLYVVLKEVSAPPPNPSPREPQLTAAIVFGSDHGLCGRFNEEISRYTLERLGVISDGPPNHRLLAVGARVAASLEQVNQSIEETLPIPGSAGQITLTVQQLLLKIDAWRHQSGVGRVYLFYNHRSQRKAYQPTDIELMPINLQRFRHLGETSWPSRSLPTFTINREQLLGGLLHHYLFVSLFRACAESQASEHASRLAAMQAAERNLDERHDEVTLNYRHARQDVITSELLDVVAGFETITSEK